MKICTRPQHKICFPGSIPTHLLHPQPPPVVVGPGPGRCLENSSSPHCCLPIWSHLDLEGIGYRPRDQGRATKGSPRWSPWTLPWSVLTLVPALQKMGELPLDINIQEPRWDQSTFLGRARHFFTVTDPRNLLLSGAQLEASRKIVQNYR